MAEAWLDLADRAYRLARHHVGRLKEYPLLSSKLGNEPQEAEYSLRSRGEPLARLGHWLRRGCGHGQSRLPNQGEGVLPNGSDGPQSSGPSDMAEAGFRVARHEQRRGRKAVPFPGAVRRSLVVLRFAALDPFTRRGFLRLFLPMLDDF